MTIRSVGVTEARPVRPASAGVRLDIQLLRAVAVGTVVLYHFWPERFPGGFVGVDVFFVISGLLITDHLLREDRDEGGIRVLRFYARRARRLLPLAFVVLLVTTALLVFVMPASQQRPGLMGVLWSSLYVQNWALASGSTDYLARDQQPLLTQHFWTLSAEEQFYLVWPLLLVLAMWLGSRFLATHPARRRRSVLLAIVVVVLVSFVHSVVFTATDPGAAYFATTTRAWEFAAGALLAFVPRDFSFLSRGQLAARIVASWVGTLVIVGTMLWLPSSAPFPSATALLPVIGAALCIMAGDVRRGDPTVLAGFRPVTLVGDLSYGIYLWHWPLLIAAPVLIGAPLVAWHKVLLLVGLFGIAWLSKRWIEDPVRFAPVLQGSTGRSFLIPLIGTVVIGAIIGGVTVAAHLRAEHARSAHEATIASGHVAPNDPTLPLTPPIADRGSDYGGMYDCFDLHKEGMEACTYGDAGATTRVALVGDSHAAHLIPGLREEAERRGWSLTTYVGMNCDGMVGNACAGGAAQLEAVIAEDYDAVLLGSFRMSYTPLEDVAATWDRLAEAGETVLPIVDVPFHPETSFACIDASEDAVDAAAACAPERAVALGTHPDRLELLAAERSAAPIDLTSFFCDDERCATVISNTVAYQDSPSSHLTASMSRLLGLPLADAVEARLR